MSSALTFLGVMVIITGLPDVPRTYFDDSIILLGKGHLALTSGSLCFRGGRGAA